MRFQLDPEDEYLHPLEAAQNFNESMYFNVYDPDARLGGFFRLGNRANEGYAEMTTCLYLPDGRAGFMFGRPAIDANDAFDAGGLSFEVVEPFVELQVRYDGEVLLLDDPLAMAHPGRAFRDSPRAPCRVDLTYRGVSPMMGGLPVADDGTPLPESGEGFARAHYEQHVSASGRIEVGDDVWDVDGFGLRDHSWGPRFWQAPWWYRWLTANFGADLGFMISVIASRDGSRRIGGVLLRDGEYEPVEDATIDTTWTDGDRYHSTLRASITCPSGTYEIRGEVLNLVPLRNRRTTPEGEELQTRISEGLTRWTLDGREGYGLSEYLDQIVDGEPVGLAG